MGSNLTDLVTARYILLTRIFIVVLGCIAVWFGIIGFSISWRESSIERIADRIIAGDPFKNDILVQQLPIMADIRSSAYCHPAALRSAAIIQLRMFEVGASTTGRSRVEELESLRSEIRNSLFCSPADPFLWLALYRLESDQRGVSAASLKYLKMSYELGPNEGWIQVKRNPNAFAFFERLPADLAEKAINEFVELLNSDFYRHAVEIFIGPAWPARHAILPRLSKLPIQVREYFVRAVYDRGLDITIPGTEAPNSRSEH